MMLVEKWSQITALRPKTSVKAHSVTFKGLNLLDDILADIAGRQLLPRFSYQGFDPRFQTVGFKTGHFNHVKSALFLYPILK